MIILKLVREYAERYVELYDVYIEETSVPLREDAIICFVLKKISI